MHSSVRRDVILTAVLALIVICLVEYRFNLTTNLILGPDPSDATESSLKAPIQWPAAVLDDPLDEFGEKPASSSNPSGLRYHVSSAFKGGKHKKHKKVTLVSPYTKQLQTTTLLKHSAGFTILDNAYLWNGTIFLVQSEAGPNVFPERRMMISSGATMSASSEQREPTDANMKVISLTEAKKLFGSRLLKLDGTSLMVYDPPELFRHYYHFSAEILFSIWRTYSTLDSKVNAAGHTSLDTPARFILPQIPATDWRDYAGMNQYILHAALPSTSIEFKEVWDDRADSLRPFVFDRLVLGDRAAAARGADPLGWEKMSSHAEEIDGASPYWWEPIRRNVVSFSGGTSHIDRREPSDVVITYVSRQGWGRRMLKDDDHARLVKALLKLKSKFGWEVNVVKMESMTREEQIALASRTTILMGVHGNGLTSLLWMQPGTTVMEFFYPEGFSYDYLYTAKMLGIEHYAFWDNKVWTHENAPRKNDYPHRGLVSGFQGTDIPIDANAVVKLCVERLRR